MKLQGAGLFVLLTIISTSCITEHIEPRSDYRDRILGYYEVEEYSQTYDDMTYYDIDITRSSDRDEVWIDNFYAADISVYAIVTYDRIRIPYQVVDGYEVEGSGVVRGSRIDFTYSVKDRYSHSATDFCETTAWLD